MNKNNRSHYQAPTISQVLLNVRCAPISSAIMTKCYYAHLMDKETTARE